MSKFYPSLLTFTSLITIKQLYQSDNNIYNTMINFELLIDWVYCIYLFYIPPMTYIVALSHVLRGACNKQLRELTALCGTAHTTRFLAAALLVLSDPRRQERRWWKLSVKYLSCRQFIFSGCQGTYGLLFILCLVFVLNKVIGMLKV